MKRGNRDASGLGTRSRQVVRRLVKDWRYSLGIIVILAIGIGPATVGLDHIQRIKDATRNVGDDPMHHPTPVLLLGSGLFARVPTTCHERE